MVSDKAQFDWGVDFDDNNYKSSFARSVAVSSQYKPAEEPLRQLDLAEARRMSQEGFQRARLAVPEPIYEPVKMRKNARSEEGRRLSCGSISLGSSRRTSICSSRISEIPVENIVNQSKVATLQWQLNEIEKSREMYKAVMKQVVTFLERAHRSLELLGGRLNTKATVPRSKSEHQIVTEDTLPGNVDKPEDYTLFRDYTWRRPKKPELCPEEIPPEKLSQEAFRLLRTAQSLMNTQEPKLTPSNNEPDDAEFLAQLAREFPQTPEPKPQRTTSFSMSPKLILPEKETRISTAFNRKLSLQLSDTRRNIYSPLRGSPRGSIVEGDIFSSTVNELMVKDMTFGDKAKFKHHEKSHSPPGGSISSVEDESGFSSMNSFQDVGLPLVEEVSAKNVLLRSMLHNGEPQEKVEDDVKLWQTPVHKRWDSTPVSSPNKQTLNVLWV